MEHERAELQMIGVGFGGEAQHMDFKWAVFHVSATPSSVFHVSHQRLKKYLFNDNTANGSYSV